MEMVPASIKMLVLDIDGTLLDPDGIITPRTLAAVRAVQEEGIIVTLATARRYVNTRKIADELGLDIPLILYDGALVVQHPGGIVLLSQPLAASVAQEAVEILARHHVQPVVHPNTGVNEEIWTGPRELDSLWITAYFTAFPEQMRRMPIESLCNGHPDPLRVVAFEEHEIIEGLLPEVSQLECSWTTLKRGSYGSAEIGIMSPCCSKASGVAALVEYLGIAMEEVMALGDNNNDIQMLRSVGWGVAMGQASEAVKGAAKAVTAPNWEDGAAQAIERYALCCVSSAFSNSRKRSIWR